MGTDSENGYPTQKNRPHPTPVDTGRFNRQYIVSLQGLLRLIIIIFQFAHWVSAASVPKIIQGEYYMTTDFADTRAACLFFSVLGFIVSLFFYILYLMNVPQSQNELDFPFSLVVFALDVFWIIPTFVIAIVCAVREGSIKNENLALLNIVNKGAFASAAFFGFALSILYTIIAFFAYKHSTPDE